MKFFYILATIAPIFTHGRIRSFSNILNKLRTTFRVPLNSEIINYPKLTYNDLTEQNKYDLQWYVVGTSTDFDINIPKKITVWNKDYVIWKNEEGKYFALDDICPHKGASLSHGTIENKNIVCPYHAYEFNSDGELKLVPGICFQPSVGYNLDKYDIVEKHGWIYLNTYSDLIPKEEKEFFKENIFVEEEVFHNDSAVFLDMDFNCYSRILSENSLDIMHIGFVHGFGNREKPAPIQIHPPQLEGPNRYKTTYTYEAGKNSFAWKYFKAKDLLVENEFILPHTTIVRVIFGNYVSTVITFALPISEKKSKLFMKTYRNFWLNPVGDTVIKTMMLQTMLQDRAIVESINPSLEDGKFNMKFDKLQNTYKTFYKRFIHRKN